MKAIWAVIDSAFDVLPAALLFAAVMSAVAAR